MPSWLAHAAAGNLHRPEVLTAQGAADAARSACGAGLATEFWRKTGSIFRRFEEHNSVGPSTLPEFHFLNCAQGDV